SELLSVAGALDEARTQALRAGRRPPPDPQRGAVDRAMLVAQVLPPEGRHILLEVAAAIAGVEAKLLRSDLTEIGISSRDRSWSRRRDRWCPATAPGTGTAPRLRSSSRPMSRA